MGEDEGLYECPSCGQIWTLVALEIEARVRDRPISAVVSDFRVDGCEAISEFHRR